MSKLQAIRFNINCAICYENYAEGDTLISPDKCGHVFHKKCLDKWLEQKKECPTCRGIIELPSISPVVAQQPSITSRSTPNIYKQLPLMETVKLYNILQALVKPVEHYKYVYHTAYPDIVECVLQTFKVSIGQATADELVSKIIEVPHTQTHRQTIVGVCAELYRALVRHIPEQNFSTNPVIRNSYLEVCNIPVIRTFREKYKSTIH